MPTLSGIDHVHIYVSDREQAARWFKKVLGFEVIAALESWATDGGPLTIGAAQSPIHLALFEKDEPTPASVVAFGASGEQFLEWQLHLAQQGLAVRCADHDLAWSLYFQDPWENLYEITTYDYDQVRAALPN
ncbi:MAG: VOC family protein [Pseudomonadales bacterium]